MLAWQSTLNGHDLYSGLPADGDQDVLRQSLHGSGQSHFHAYGERLITNRGTLPSPKRIKGAVRAGDWVVSERLLGRSKSAPSESSHRRNLVLDPVAVGVSPRGWNVRLWLLEGGHPDLAEALLEEHRYFPWLILGTLHADWTDPQLYAIVVSPTREQWAMANSANLPARPWRPKLSIEVKLKRKGSI
jgi:hypothetical protein